ncbi:MAG: hypothetical protein A2Y66_03565 [Nitrospirae bacterium RBG_13_41_22]|nr:MAG: hypothetical protein A2Y66_03565 [Nitrospirae bacterium RBG_13_41_22]
MDISNIQKCLDDFARQRNRDQFRSRKNLSMSLAAEAAELLEYIQLTYVSTLFILSLTLYSGGRRCLQRH